MLGGYWQFHPLHLKFCRDHPLLSPKSPPLLLGCFRLLSGEVYHLSFRAFQSKLKFHLFKHSYPDSPDSLSSHFSP